MQTECTPNLFGFEPVEGRQVVAAFDGGPITSDAGALLLGAADRSIAMMHRLAACFHDTRRQHLIEHEVATLVGQRVFGIALGYEDLNDHDTLRHDPVRRCWQVSSKRTARIVRRWRESRRSIAWNAAGWSRPLITRSVIIRWRSKS